MQMLRAPMHRLSRWFRRQSRLKRDLIVMSAIMLPLYVTAVWFDAFDRFLAFTHEPESDAIDWLIILFVFLGIGAKIYSVRRTVDLHHEVRRRRQAEHEAYELARQDVLTGLPNRRWFIEEFDKLTGQSSARDACAVFVVDLDNFKPINDVYGHRLGDEVLRVIAKRLSQLAKGAAVARLGGDEFGIIMHYRGNSDAPERLARQIVHQVSKPIHLASLALQVGVSVGVSTSIPGVSGNLTMANRDGAPVHTALRQADMAMYWAKAEGRARYCFFDRTMDEKLQQRVELEAEIAGAIEAGQIVPYYQPLVDLTTSKTVGFEVLARWLHPLRGVLPPEAFITIAEDTGNIGAMTERLLKQALNDAKTWPDSLFVSVNFTPRQISDSMLATKILGLLAKSSFPPHRLVIEITESAVVQRLEDAKAVLQSLRDAGVRVALDDFGTGYSGLYHLRELDLDIIKIDRSFVTKMLDKPEEAKIVKAIVSLSHALGLHTTAEGVETTQILDRLVKLGCETGQGDLFGVPMPAATTATAIAEHTRTRSHRRRA
ncbi:putative bifunctional diguanylate cyclase/phosphodiesterase [Methyloceanibacter sp.]|uniref:putative bifunctional diguanylate cyclase/phosphodiesterase n=1 Tax=Methyloceanibacter sp. TaxID=1965321 RepID=UPI002D298CC8|nr:EAL domain-containing protein [Methyloceanibacter sp.]HZP07855.1 EAL domain-containing protein [Methyloceanibacter sp.]